MSIAPSDPAVKFNAHLEPGQFVRNPDAPEWGLGQVQSNADGRLTATFENRGKIVINGDSVRLTPDFLS